MPLSRQWLESMLCLRVAAGCPPHSVGDPSGVARAVGLSGFDPAFQALHRTICSLAIPQWRAGPCRPVDGHDFGNVFVDAMLKAGYT